MVRTPEKNFLRAWREFREMTQAELAEAVGTTGAVISLLESGARGLSDKWLRRLAPVLKTRPGHLLETDPANVDSDLLEIWARIPDEDKDQARAILRTFGRKRGEGPDSASTPTPSPGDGGDVVPLKPVRRGPRDPKILKRGGESEGGG